MTSRVRPRPATALTVGLAPVLAVVLAAVLAPVTAGSAGARAAGVATHQVFHVPHSGRFRIAGHGYGHGHGMSQYGAEGAARQGLSYRRILAFYYPHTRLRQMHGRIRVLLSADTDGEVRIRNQRGLRVVDRGSGRTYALPYRKGVRAWRLVVRRHHTVVQFRTRGWHRHRVGRKHLAHLRGDGEFRARSKRLRLVVPGGPRSYRGALRGVSARGSAKLTTVNVLPIDAYVRGVVPLEMPTLWHSAAVRAQAVAARTYALFERADHRRDAWQVCDTTLCQVYGGLDAETTGGNAAVRATRGRYLAHGGGPAFTQFSSSSGGWTAAGGRPYLPEQRDPYDAWPGNPVHSWKVAVRARVLEDAWPGIGDLRTITVTRRAGHGQWKGRVLRVRLAGSTGSRTVTGSDVAAAYGLRSTWFLPVAG